MAHFLKKKHLKLFDKGAVHLLIKISDPCPRKAMLTLQEFLIVTVSLIQIVLLLISIWITPCFYMGIG